MGTAIRMIGRRFGRLKVLSLARERNGNRYWLCLCDCGKQKEVFAGSLRSGRSKSCGCLSKELTVKRSTTHGRSYDRLYAVHQQMIARCHRKSHPAYKDYGDRGVTVMKRWRGKNGLANFIADLGEPDNPKLTVERRNVNGNYCPSNCYWATRKEQARNMRTNRMLTIGEESKCLAAWADEARCGVIAFKNRIKRGWDPERAFATPKLR